MKHAPIPPMPGTAAEDRPAPRRARSARPAAAGVVVAALTATTLLPAAPASAAPDPNRAMYLTPGQLNGATVVTETATESATGTYTSTDTETHDRNGRPTSRLSVTVDTAGDEVQRVETSWEYDSRGRLTREVTATDPDGTGPAGPTTLVRTTTFDKQDYVLSKVTTIDLTSDGVVDSTSNATFDRDHRGRPLTSTTADDTDNDGTIDGSTVTTTTYDGRGRVTSVEDTTLDGTGAVVSRLVSSQTFDQQGRNATSTTSHYAGATTLTRRTTYINAYDKQGNVTSLHAETDADGDGDVDGLQVYTYTYDSSGRLIDSSVSSYMGATTSTPLQSRATAHNVYDSQARIVRSEYRGDADGDGTDDNLTVQSTTYDSQGRRTSDVTTVDYGADGTVELTYTSTRRYDSKGRYAGADTISTDATGTLTYADRSTVTYPDKATLLTVSEFDTDGDGVYEQTYTQRRTVT